MIALFIPTFQRSGILKKRAENIHTNTKLPHKIYFIVEAGDTPTIEAVKALGETYIIRNEGKDCYADCINTAYKNTKEPFMFVGADDLNFMPEWDTEAMKLMDDPSVGVVGTNDLHNPIVMRGENATHYLVRRDYIDKETGTIDKSFPMLYPFDHNWTDTEFCGTAISRGRFKMAFNSKVEHLHPCWGLSRMDATYNKGYRNIRPDELLFRQREKLWKKS